MGEGSNGSFAACGRDAGLKTGAPKRGAPDGYRFPGTIGTKATPPWS